MADPARFSYRDHLVRLVARSEAAAARIAAADPVAVAALRRDARRTSARLSAKLDASPLTDETADRVDAEGLAEVAAVSFRLEEGPSHGGWAQALKLEGMPTQEVAAVEYANVLACRDLEEDLADDFFAHPLDVLTRLHERLVRGLVDPQDVGRLRSTELAVHDGAQGMVVYRTPAPAELPALLDSLLSWLGRGSATKPALVVAGVMHERLLEWQPFGTAAGRLARAAGRVVLRARGVDPDGLAVPERRLAADPVAYHAEIAASMRRRGDLTAWLERIGEATVTDLEAVADRLTGVRPEVPDRAMRVLADLGPGEALSVPRYVEVAGVERESAFADLHALERAGQVVTEPGTQGLRYLVLG